MKKTTREYLAPETEVINMKLEGVIAASGGNEGLGSSGFNYGDTDFD